MTRNEYNEFRSIRADLKRFTLGHGTTLTIRTDASADYKMKLHGLYTSLNFHPASVRVDSHYFDDKERIIYIYGADEVHMDFYGRPFTWEALYTAEEKARFAAALTDEWEAFKAAQIAQEAAEEPTADIPAEDIEKAVTEAVAAEIEAQTGTEEEETPATPGEMLKVRNIIMGRGGYREAALLKAPHTMTHGDTWNDAHKVVYILAATPEPDGYRPGCAVDIVTRSIVG